MYINKWNILTIHYSIKVRKFKKISPGIAPLQFNVIWASEVVAVFYGVTNLST